MPNVYLVAGARPNFMKIAPIIRAIEADRRLRYKLIHTGQHYDRDMNDVFFEDLGIPQPSLFMGCGGGTHAQQTAKIMVGFEELCVANRPDCVLVVGDVNSTLACAIVAKKLGVPVAHVEAGLRSGDLAMPEEINRIVTDSISDWFFVTEPAGVANLKREGKPDSAIHFVGHVMVDNVLYQANKLKTSDVSRFETSSYKSRNVTYGVVTLHRPSNVDDESVFVGIAAALRQISAGLPLIFPVHPRTRSTMEKFGIDMGQNVSLVGPLGYMEFLNLWKDARVVLTDSGGLQEETTALGVPCITLRDNTERPITIAEGTNILAGTDSDGILAAARSIMDGRGKFGRQPALWDGKAAVRIVKILGDAFEARGPAC
ncbi:MAG TPA: UDP-N-acetylglucosamine 2-epimerase (non-hydrolyzing) [Blastocatellia bacterium]|nr:UDP-N-acetylglucosamine 2-epimerase (non-hydrolyzing) [Blastocatellia bacterium]